LVLVPVKELVLVGTGEDVTVDGVGEGGDKLRLCDTVGAVAVAEVGVRVRSVSVKCMETVQLEGLGEGEAEALRLRPVGVGLSVTVQENETDKLTVRRTLAVQEWVPVWVADPVAVDDRLFVMLRVPEALGDGESVAERRDKVNDVGDAKLGVSEPLPKRVRVCVQLSVVVTVLGLTESEGEQLPVGDTDGALLDVTEAVRVEEQLELRIGVADSGVRVEQVRVRDEDSENVGVPVWVSVSENVGVHDGLGMMEQVALTVCVLVGEDEGDVENDRDRSEETVRE